MATKIEGLQKTISSLRGQKRRMQEQMNSGQIIITVSKDETFRQSLAEAIVIEADPGYSTEVQGAHYADPVEGRIYIKQSSWNPWSDSDDWKIIPIELLIDDYSSYDFSDQVDWSKSAPELNSYRDMAIAYLGSEGKALDDNGDLPEWIDGAEVIALAREMDEFVEEIENYEEIAHNEAVSLVLGAIAPKVTLNITGAEVA